MSGRPAANELDMVEEQYTEKGYRLCGDVADWIKLLWKNFPHVQKGQNQNLKDSKIATVVSEGCVIKLFVCGNGSLVMPVPVRPTP